MIQIDMSMPTNCLDCPACNEYLTCAIPVNGRKWGENDVREFGQGRPEWCPMKELVICKDCKWLGRCELSDLLNNETGFCPDGERDS